MAATFEDLDLSDGWTDTGVTHPDDQHNTGAGTFTDGVNDYQTKTHESGLATIGDTEGSFEIWVRNGQWDTATRIICGQTASTGSAWGLYFTGVGADNLYFSVFGIGGGDSTARVNQSYLPVGVWVHVVGTFKLDGSTNPKLYFNGVEAAAYTSQTTLSDTLKISTDMAIGAFNDGSSYARGEFSRFRYYQNDELTSGEISTQYTAEFDAVFVPTYTQSDNDLSDGWTALGTVTNPDDQHNPEAAAEFNGDADSRLTLTGDGIFSMGQVEAGFSGWIKLPSTPLGQRIICCNQDNFNTLSQNKGAMFVWANQDGKLGCTMHASQGNATQSHSAASLVDTGDWVHVGASATGDGNKVQLTINGVEPTYSLQDSNSGAGFSTGFAGTPENMKLGDNVQIDSLIGIVARPRWWAGVAPSLAQLNKEYENEVAAIGEGFSTGILSPIISPHVSPIISGIL